jgi:predicted  nucleic acid-binding Zn-ribbon protein
MAHNENPKNPRLQAAEAELDAARQVLKDANKELKEWKANTSP